MVKHNPCFYTDTASASKQQQGGVVKVIQLSRANNVSIMLTTFGEVKPADLRKMLLTGRGLTLDKLSILLQVSGIGGAASCKPAVGNQPGWGSNDVEYTARSPIDCSHGRGGQGV